MQKKIIFGTVAISVVVAVSGYFVGRHTAISKGTTTTTISAQDGTTTKVTVVGQPTKVAVVNQDQGTMLSNSESLNYASEVIKTLNDNYVVTSREAAKKGLTNGTYAAMIVLPSNFSNNAVSINTSNPTKVEVYYEMNKELDATTNALIRNVIQDFQNDLNTKFSVMYIQEILGEVHRGQEYVEQIFNNDTKDLEAINSINDIEILKGINLTDLEAQNINIENIDFTKNFEDNKEIMNQLDNIYKEKINTNEAQVASIKSQLNTLVNDETTGLKGLQNKISKLTTEQLIEALAKSHNYDYEKLKELYDINVEDVNQYIKDSLTDSTNLDQEKTKNAISEIDSMLEENEKSANTIKGYLKSDSNANTDSSTTTETTPSLSDSSLSQEYLLYGEITNELMKSNPTLFEELYTKVADKKTVSYNKILKNIQGTNTADNIFADSADLKSYLLEKSAGTTDFVAERNTAYSAAKQSDKKDDNSTTNNITDNQDVVNKIKTEAEKIKTNTEKVKSSENYKYIKDLFDEKSENSLANVLANAGKDSKKEELINKIKENNKILIEKTKEVVESQIETDGIVNVTALMGMLDEQYIAKFEDILGNKNVTGTTTGETQQPISEEDAKIVELWMRYDLMNKDLTSSVTTQLSQYTEVVQTSQKNANEHVQLMRESLDKGIEEAQNNINSTIEQVQAGKQATTDSNRKNLSSFANMLQNTKVGSSENTSLYSFIANPISVQENRTLGSGVASVMSNDNDTFRFITLGAVFGAILYATLKMRKRLNKQSK